MSYQPTLPDDKESSTRPPGSSLRTLPTSSTQPEYQSQAGQVAPLSRASDTLRRELPPLQPVLERPVGPLGGVQSILNPPQLSTTVYQGVSRPDQVAQQSAASSTSSFGERPSATVETARPTLQSQGSSSYRQAEFQRPGPRDESANRPQTGGRWSPSSILPAASATYPSAGYSGGQSQTVPSASSLSSQSRSISGDLSAYPTSVSQWQAEQRGRGSSQNSADRPAALSIGMRPDDHPKYMTLQTERGPVAVPLNTQTASKAADEKRKRNAGASARFRRRRKDKERESSSAIDTLKQRLDDAEQDRDFYRGERDYLGSIVYNGTERAQHFPRPPSPRHFRRAPQPVNPSQSSSPGSSTYQDRSRDPQSAASSRRMTGESLTSTPVVPQEPSQSQYGYAFAAGQSSEYVQPPQYYHQGFQQYGQPLGQQTYQPLAYQQQYAPHQGQSLPSAQVAQPMMVPPTEQGYQQQTRSQQPQQPGQPQPPNQRQDMWPR